MEVRQYRIFKEVAETGSFTKAAANLYITQSAVSHAVRDLEERAGTVLFDRLSKSISITESGRLLLEEVIRFLRPVMPSIPGLEVWKKRHRSTLFPASR